MRRVQRASIINKTMKKLLILLLLVPSLSWGEEYSTLDFEIEDDTKACIDNPNYNASKSNKLGNKRDVNYNKCLLKHSSNNSSLTRTDIKRACWDLAQIKYPFKNYERAYENLPCQIN